MAVLRGHLSTAIVYSVLNTTYVSYLCSPIEHLNFSGEDAWAKRNDLSMYEVVGIFRNAETREKKTDSTKLMMNRRAKPLP